MKSNKITEEEKKLILTGYDELIVEEAIENKTEASIDNLSECLFDVVPSYYLWNATRCYKKKPAMEY